MKKVHRIDPDFDIQVIDRSLTPSEALHALRSKHHLQGQARPAKAGGYLSEYKGFLFDTGIKHPGVQNAIIRQDKPISQDHLDLVAYVMQQRPHRNVKMDIKRKAKLAKSVQQWAKAPNRYDLQGVDTPGSKFIADWF